MARPQRGLPERSLAFSDEGKDLRLEQGLYREHASAGRMAREELPAQIPLRPHPVLGETGDAAAREQKSAHRLESDFCVIGGRPEAKFIDFEKEDGRDARRHAFRRYAAGRLGKKYYGDSVTWSGGVRQGAAGLPARTAKRTAVPIVTPREDSSGHVQLALIHQEMEGWLGCC